MIIKLQFFFIRHSYALKFFLKHMNKNVLKIHEDSVATLSYSRPLQFFKMNYSTVLPNPLGQYLEFEKSNIFHQTDQTTTLKIFFISNTKDY